MGCNRLNDATLQLLLPVKGHEVKENCQPRVVDFLTLSA